MALMMGPPIGKIGGVEVQSKTLEFNGVRTSSGVVVLTEEEIGGEAIVALEANPVRYSNSPYNIPEIRVGSSTIGFLNTDKNGTVADVARWGGLISGGPLSLRGHNGGSSSIYQMDFTLEVKWITIS